MLDLGGYDQAFPLFRGRTVTNSGRLSPTEQHRPVLNFLRSIETARRVFSISMGGPNSERDEHLFRSHDDLCRQHAQGGAQNAFSAPARWMSARRTLDLALRSGRRRARGGGVSPTAVLELCSDLQGGGTFAGVIQNGRAMLPDPQQLPTHPDRRQHLHRSAATTAPERHSSRLQRSTPFIVKMLLGALVDRAGRCWRRSG